MTTEPYVMSGLAALMLGPFVWFAFAQIFSSIKGRRRAKKRAAEKAERRRNFQRSIYPALMLAPNPGCGNAPAIPTTLDLNESLESDTTALMTCQVLLDGEEVHGWWKSWLEARFGRRIRRLADVERIAQSYAHQEWLIKFVQPLQSMVYQRHADGQWNLVRVGQGMF